MEQKSNASSQTDDMVLGKRSSEEANNANVLPSTAAVATPSEAGQSDNGDNGASSTRIVEGLLRITIDNVRSMCETIRSEPKIINNVPWKIMVMPRQHTVTKKTTQRCLGFFLQCCPNSYSDSWSCQASAELRMLAQKPGVNNFIRKTTHEYTSKENDWGYSCFMTWADVLDETQGYVLKGSIILEVLVRAEPPKGILSHEAFVKKIEEYIRLAELQSSRGLIDKAIEVNMSAAKFCKDKDVEVKDRLEAQRVALIKQKLHESIERIENCDKVPKEGNDFHTLNSLRHALVGNMACSKNGHHKGAYKDKSAAVRTVQHTCHLSKDGKCKIRQVKKTMAVPLTKCKGGVCDQELREQMKRDSVDSDKISSDKDNGSDSGCPIKEAVTKMVNVITDNEPPSIVNDNGLVGAVVEEEHVCRLFGDCESCCSGGDPFENIHLGPCQVCYSDALTTCCPTLLDELEESAAARVVLPHLPIVKCRKSTKRAAGKAANDEEKAEKESSSHGGGFPTCPRLRTSKMSMNEVMDYFKDEFNSKTAAIKANLERINAAIKDLVEIDRRMKFRQLADGERADKEHLKLPDVVQEKQEHLQCDKEDVQESMAEQVEPEATHETKKSRSNGAAPTPDKTKAPAWQQQQTVAKPDENVVTDAENLHIVKAVLKQAQVENGKLSEQCKRLEKANGQLQLSLRGASEKLEKANQLLKERRADLKKLEKRVKADNAMASENALLLRKLESVEVEQREAKSKAEETRRRLTDENRRLQETKKTMQKELDYSSAEVERLQCLLEEKQSALSTLEKDRAKERANHQVALNEATERAKRAEVVILELRLDYGLKMLLRAHEDCVHHLAQFEDVTKKHASVMSPVDVKMLSTYQQEWLKLKLTLSEMMQKAKVEFQEQIDAVLGGKLLSSLPVLDIPKPPPQPTVPRICISKGQSAQRQATITPIGRPAPATTPNALAGSSKLASGSSADSISPSKMNARYEGGGGGQPVTSTSYAAAAVSDRNIAYNLQQVAMGAQRAPCNAQQRPVSSDPMNLQQQTWLNGKAFGTLFDSFGCTADESPPPPAPSSNQWSWNSAACGPPLGGVSPVQSVVSEYSSTPSSTRPPSGGPSRSSPLFQGLTKWGDGASPAHSQAISCDPMPSSFQPNTDAIMSKLFTMFPSVSIPDLKSALEEYRMSQPKKSLKGQSPDSVIAHVGRVIMARSARSPNPAKQAADSAIGNGHLPADTVCVLCKQSYGSKSSALKSLVCRHRFHANCIQKWLGENQCCPICATNKFAQEEYPALN